MMTAEQLKMPQPIYDGLCKFVELAEAGQIPHEPELDSNPYEERCPATTFNMRRVRCGAAGCIKGWLPQLAGVDRWQIDEMIDSLAGAHLHSELRFLFFPNEIRERYHPGCIHEPYEAGPRWAAAATRSLLETGTTDWYGTHCAG